jgi:hypothetical protein
MKFLAQGKTALETLLYKALQSPCGLVIRSPQQDTLIRKLYNIRATRHAFKGLTIVKQFKNEIWLVKKEPDDGSPETGRGPEEETPRDNAL